MSTVYDLEIRTRPTVVRVSHVATEELVREFAGDVLAAVGTPLPDSLTALEFPTQLAETGAYDETIQDGSITVRRSEQP